MHLASINSAEEQKDLQDHIQAYGESNKHTLMKFQALIFPAITTLKRPLKWYYVTKIVLTYCEKKYSGVREKLLKFDAEGREFAKCLRSLEQFIRTVKGQQKV